MTPAVLAATIAASLLLAALPRRVAAIPLVLITFLTPFGQQILIGGAHFYVTRILAIIGILRLLLKKDPLTSPTLRISALDRAFCFCSIAAGMGFILRERTGGAIINQVGTWIDIFGTYFIFRRLLQDREDIYRIIKTFALVASVLGICMTYEYLTRNNIFSYLAGYEILPWIRNGRIRAQGPFGNSITAGAFGATLLPLFFVLWRSAKAKIWAIAGFIGASAIAFTSMASTPITGYLAGILAIALWPIRNRMKWVRWSIVAGALGLALVMKAPVWFVITRFNVAGGHAYDRAILIDQTVRHFSEWWLVGTNTNASWGLYTWDACNQFVFEGLYGGLATLVFFIMIIWQGFTAIGQSQARMKKVGDKWFFWGLGAALFAQVVVFLGVDYFDQMQMQWYIFVAILSVATVSARLAPTRLSNRSNGQLTNERLRAHYLGRLHGAPNRAGVPEVGEGSTTWNSIRNATRSSDFSAG